MCSLSDESILNIIKYLHPTCCKKLEFKHRFCPVGLFHLCLNLLKDKKKKSIYVGVKFREHVSFDYPGMKR